jgi:hypothetical protein
MGLKEDAMEEGREGEGTGGGSGVFAKVVDILAAIRLFFGEVRHSLVAHADSALRRVQVLFMLYLWVSVGLVLMLLGAFQWAVDLGLPRGPVFLSGGLLVTLVSIIALQAMRTGKKG